MKTMKMTVIVFAACVLLLAGCSTMPIKPEALQRGDYGYTREYVSWLIRQEMDKHRVTGLSIALVDDQNVVWSEGFGFADKAKAVPASPDTVYRTGPISQLLTATAVMQLADDKTLDIDQPLKNYLPGFSVNSRFPYAAPITPRTILTHHSGLPADVAKGMWTDSPEPFGELSTQLRDEYVAAPPDYCYAPSTIGMTILGQLLEKITGRDFAPHMDISLFLALRMNNSAFSTRIDRSSLASRAYHDGTVADEPPLRDVPALGLNSSVADLSRFISMVFADGWFGGRLVLREQTMAEMLRPQNTGVPLDHSLRVGLGWMLDSPEDIHIRNGGAVPQIGGGTWIHRSRLALLPDHKLGVVVLANSDSAGSVVDKVAAETLKRALETKTGITQTQPPPQPPDAARDAKTVSLSGGRNSSDTAAGDSAESRLAGLNATPKKHKPENQPEPRRMLTDKELQEYEGRYATTAGVVAVVKKSDYLETELFGRSVRLTPRSDGLLGTTLRLPDPFTFNMIARGEVGIDRAIVDGRDILKAVIDGREYLIGERLRAAAVPDGWLRRLGRYEVINVDQDSVPVKSILLRHDAGILTAEYELPLADGIPMSIALTPLSEKEAVISGLGRNSGETVRVITREGAELLAYSGYLFRKTAE